MPVSSVEMSNPFVSLADGDMVVLGVSGSCRLVSCTV